MIDAIDPGASRAELLRLWNDSLSASFPLGDELFLQGLGPGTEAKVCLAARGEAGRLLGFALVKAGVPQESILPGVGNLSLLFVDPGARREGIGSALLAAGEAWLRAEGGQGILVGADRRHYFPGVPVGEDGQGGDLAAFLAARGYQAEALEHDLLGPIPGGMDEAPEGLAWAWGEEGHRDTGEDFFQRNFPGRWTSEFRQFLDSRQDPRDFLLLLERESGRVLGFCRTCRGDSGWLQPGLYWRTLLEGEIGALGPIGVDAAQRGKGLGLALLRRGLQELGARGAGRVVIDWTDQVDFYAPLGFGIWKSYRPYWKRF